MVFVLAVKIDQIPSDLCKRGYGNGASVRVGFSFAFAVQFAAQGKYVSENLLFPPDVLGQGGGRKFRRYAIS